MKKPFLSLAEYEEFAALVHALAISTNKVASTNTLQRLQFLTATYRNRLLPEIQFKMAEIVIAAGIASGSVLRKNSKTARVRQKLYQFERLAVAHWSNSFALNTKAPYVLRSFQLPSSVPTVPGSGWPHVG